MRNIFMLSGGDSGCGWYRATLPARFCTSCDWTIDLKDWLAEEDMDSYDAFVFHRIPKPGTLELVAELKDRGKRVAWELDDDFWSIPSWNPASQSIRPADLERLDSALDMADLIFVSTAELAGVVGRPAKTRVLPNLLPVDYFPPVKKGRTDCLTVLWAGSCHHTFDLLEVVEPLEELMRRYGEKVQFVFFGDLPEPFTSYIRISGTMLGKAISARRQVGLVDAVELRRYYPALSFLAPDICIAPLCEVPFNHSKSNVKWLEYTAVGAATVASPLSPYGCIRHGVDGLHASTSADWVEALSALIEDAGYRERLAAGASERLRAEFAWDGPGRSVWDWALTELVS